MKSLRNAVLAVILPFLLHACAKSSAGPVTAYLAKGPVTGAQCELRKAHSNKVLAGPVTSEDGHVSFGVLNYHGLAYVACQGGSYVDELSGKTFDIGAGTLRSAKVIAGPAHFVVTPITEIAVKRAVGMSKQGVLEDDHVAKSNRKTADDFGLGHVDIVSENPTDPRNHAIENTPAGWYGAVLAGLSGLVNSEADLALYAADEAAIVSIDPMLDKILDRLADPAQDDVLAPAMIEELVDLLPSTEAKPVTAPTEVIAGIIGGMGDQSDNVPGQPVQTLAVASVTPDSAPAHGGLLVNVIGIGFQDSMTVSLGGQEITGFTVNQEGTHLSFVTLPFSSDLEADTRLPLVLEQGGMTYTVADAITVSCAVCNEEHPAVAAAGCPL